ncbi:MAG: hypothetical protein ACYTGX_02360 [Planctomycetota bacterium]
MAGPADFLDAQRDAWVGLGPDGEKAHAEAMRVLANAATLPGAAAATALARAIEVIDIRAREASVNLRGLAMLRAVAGALAGADVIAAALGTGSPEQHVALVERYRNAALGGGGGTPPPGATQALPTPEEARAAAGVPKRETGTHAKPTIMRKKAPPKPEAKPGPLQAVGELADAVAGMPMVDQRYAGGLRQLAAADGGDESLIAALNAVDRLVAEHPEPGYADLWAAAGDALAELIDHLDDNYLVLPGIDNDPGELRSQQALDPGLCHEKKVSHAEPAGALVAIHRRALRKGDERVQSAGLVVSAGNEQRWQTLLRKGREACTQVEAALAVPALAARAKLQKLESKPPADEASEMRLLRFAANALAPLEREPHCRPAVDAIVNTLREHGIRDFSVNIGEKFGDQYGAKKYERKLVTSDKPEGTVVGILQRGFTDRMGTPLQKAVVQVAKKG